MKLAAKPKLQIATIVFAGRPKVERVRKGGPANPKPAILRRFFVLSFEVIRANTDGSKGQRQ